MRRKTIGRIGLLGLALMLSLSGCLVLVEWIDSSADLSIRLKWDDESTDLDLYVTYPRSSSVTSGSVPEYASILDAYNPQSVFGGNNGFFPEDGAALQYRSYVNQDDQESENGKMEYRRPSDTTEVIELFGIPFPYGALNSGDYDSTPTTANALPQGYDYAWIGVMEVYVYGERGTVSGAGNVEVEIYDGDERLIASIPVDEDTYPNPRLSTKQCSRNSRPG